MKSVEKNNCPDILATSDSKQHYYPFRNSHFLYVYYTYDKHLNRIMHL